MILCGKNLILLVLDSSYCGENLRVRETVISSCFSWLFSLWKTASLPSGPDRSDPWRMFLLVSWRLSSEPRISHLICMIPTLQMMKNGKGGLEGSWMMMWRMKVCTARWCLLELMEPEVFSFFLFLTAFSPCCSWSWLQPLPCFVTHVVHTDLVLGQSNNISKHTSY